jgi:hypothetical protein
MSHSLSLLGETCEETVHGAKEVGCHLLAGRLGSLSRQLVGANCLLRLRPATLQGILPPPSDQAPLIKTPYKRSGEVVLRWAARKTACLLIFRPGGGVLNFRACESANTCGRTLKAENNQR